VNGGEALNDLRIVGLSMSPRRNANTRRMIQEALQASIRFGEQADMPVQVETIELAGKRILPCAHCDACSKTQSLCVLEDDWLEAVRRISDPPPNGLIIGSPVYFLHGNALGRAFLERCTSLLKRNWNPSFPFHPPDFSATACGAVAVGSSRHSGIEHTLSDTLDWFLVMGGVVVGGWNLGAGGWTRGESTTRAVEGDLLGLAAARLLGRKIAKTAILLAHGVDSVGHAFPQISSKDVVKLNAERALEAEDRSDRHP
jgi:multimeric flavodoxin WrbA